METKGEIQMAKQKVDDLMSRPPPNKRSRMKDNFDPAKVIDDIRQLYIKREGWLTPFPWCGHFRFSFDDIYTRLNVIYKKKTTGTATDRVVKISKIFNPHEECKEPRVVLIEGKPGMGKTTYCEKIVSDWATQKRATRDYFAKCLLVLLIKCREVYSDLWEAIDDQLLPRNVHEEQRKRFFDFIRYNQSEVLLVLDGLDEVSEKKLPIFAEVIQGRVLSNCRVVVTARHEAGVKVREYCDTLLELEGFTDGDAGRFIKKYFKTRKHLANKLTDRLRCDQELGAMAANPLNCALFCLVWEELNGAFPESRSELYMIIVECVLRRYRAKKQLSEDEEDLVGYYESQLNHLGSIALRGLLEDNLDFGEKELGKHKARDLTGLGFLSVQPGGSKLRPTRRYGFLHKTFQEFFAAFNLGCQLIEREISTESIAADRRYHNELKEVLLFTFGFLAARCNETAESLVKSLATQLNQEDSDIMEVTDSMNFILECINECKNDNDLDANLARALGPCLQIEALDFSQRGLQDTCAVLLLTNVLMTNTSVREVNLRENNIGEAGVAALAVCLKENTNLTELYLSENNIGEAGADALAECLKENTSLTKLHLPYNKIGEAGAAALAECLKENAYLTDLLFAGNNLGDAGAAALAECLKENATLAFIHLGENDIGYGGAAALAECLKENTSLTELYLPLNEIGDAGAAVLAECLKENTSLTCLDFSGNNLGDSGAAALAECLKENASLKKLYLEENGIGYGGADSLAECLKENTSLTELYLLFNQIGDAGAAVLAECLKENTSLTSLDFSLCNLGDSGAVALAECLKENESLTKLRLDENGIGYAGTAALAECLTENTSLTKLYLHHNEIGDGGAAVLADCLKENTSLTKLCLHQNEIGDAGAAALAVCLKENTSLTKLYLHDNIIGDAGAAVLAECLKENTSLTVQID